jgi:hypothetical protein
MARMRAALVVILAGLAGGRVASDEPVVTGLDHVPIAVRDLEQAAERYRALGFTPKPGRPHDNGIRNEHAKFADGSELELITAPEARDTLTTTYRRHLAAGEGPAFLALFAPSRDAAAARLEAAGLPGTRRAPYLSFADGGGLGYLFLGPRNASPTDRPEHFAHANGALALVAVWLAGAGKSEERLFEALGARLAPAEVFVPERTTTRVARFAEGDVLLLPADRQLVPGRRIIGATVRVRSLDAAEAALAKGPVAVPARARTPSGRSLFLPAAQTHGLWLEMRESP